MKSYEDKFDSISSIINNKDNEIKKLKEENEAIINKLKYEKDQRIKNDEYNKFLINKQNEKNQEDINELEKKRIGSDERQLYNELEEKDDIESDELNQIAKIVLERISDKLNGTDFNKNEELKVKEQVNRLIEQATSHENLSQSYLGWCPFW